MSALQKIVLINFLIFNIILHSSICRADTSIAGFHEFEGMIIDSIVIDNRNIYDTKQNKYDKFLFQTANKLHITTQKKIIRREILLQIGKPFSGLLAEETERILRDRLVLYDAWIEKEIYENDKLLIRIVTIDRWSLSAGVDASFEGNVKKFKIGALEKNLLGQNKLISFHYISQSDDDNYNDASLSEKRLFGYKLMGHVSMSSNPLHTFKRAIFERPYFDLNQRFGFFLSTNSNEGRVDYYENDSLVAQSTFKGNNTVADIFYRIGSYKTKYFMSLSHAYNIETNNTSQVLSVDVQDSLFHTTKIGFSYSKFEYEKLYNIDGFNFTEDFNKGLQLSVNYSVAYSPLLDKSIYNLFSVYMRKNILLKNSLFTMQFQYKDWTNRSDNIRKSHTFNLKYFNQSYHNITFAVNAEIRSDVSKKVFDLVSLGGTSGMRGVDKFFLTGDTKYLLNTELRLLPQLEILSFNFGGVIFSDIAKILRSEEDFQTAKTYSSFGVGLRIAFDKSTKNILRIDFAHSGANGWQLSFGSGQYFNAASGL